jgi:predicted DNA-binding antitoxin AbrB/MazE fold protein
MTKTVEAVYENGVFKPVKKVKLPEKRHFKLTISPAEENEKKIKKIVERQKKALKKLIGIGHSGLTDVSTNHDKYIYERDW